MWLYLIVGAVVLQRLAELLLSRRNARRLLASGGREAGRGHYPVMVLLHASWLASLLLLVDPATPPRPGWLALYLLLQLARVWVVVSLGKRWTTRVIVVPGAALVERGPYRFMRHPNYVVVAAEVLVLPLVFDAWQIALAFSLANALLLAWRMRIEDQALGRG